MSGRYPIETGRLLLRPKTLEDLPFMHRLFSDPAVVRYLGDGKPRSLERVRQMLLAHVEHERVFGFSLWLACERPGGEPVGDCGLMPLDGGPEVEVGYRFVPAVWGRGYATEGAAAALRHGFDVAGLEEIVAVAKPENRASRRVLEKIGMTYEGRCVYYQSDLVRYAIRRSAAEHVEVVDHDRAWPSRFEQERDRIAAVLGAEATGIEHIGSTAVSGLAAKPVIDILVGLRAYPLAPQCIAALEGLGYVYRGEFGIPGRQYFRQGSPATHHVHATLEGGDIWRSHIAFRDWLRAHPDDAARYGELKRRLAAEHRESRALYTEAKAPFVESILGNLGPR